MDMKTMLAAYAASASSSATTAAATAVDKQQAKAPASSFDDTRKRKAGEISSAGATTNTGNPDGIISVVFQGHEGFKNSVTHYYHFFFGAMIPLIEYHLNNRARVSGYKVATDIGPMKRLLAELPLNFTEFVGAEHSMSRIEASNARSPSIVALPAYDTFKDDLYGEFPMLNEKTRDRVLAFFESTMPSYIRCIPTCDVVLVERTNEEQYYRSLEKKTLEKLSGAQLRSINNHTTLVDALRSEFGSRFNNLVLERASIYYQYHIFSHAQLVIAQHGAALSNIFFMKSTGATVIEISPPSPNVLPQFRQSAKSHFRNLAKHFKIQLLSLEQNGIHSDVPVQELMDLIKTVHIPATTVMDGKDYGSSSSSPSSPSSPSSSSSSSAAAASAAASAASTQIISSTK